MPRNRVFMRKSGVFYSAKNVLHFRGFRDMIGVTCGVTESTGMQASSYSGKGELRNGKRSIRNL